MYFLDFPITKKLAVGFGCVVAIIAFSSIFLFHQTRVLYEIERLNDASDKAVDDIDQIRMNLARAQSAVRKLILTGVQSDKDGYEQAISAYGEQLKDLKAILNRDSPDLLPQLDSYEAAVADYIAQDLTEEARLALVPATRDQAVAITVSGRSRLRSAAIHEKGDDLREAVNAWSEHWTSMGHQSMSRILVTVAASGVLSTILAFLMGWLIARTIGKPIRSMTQTMQALAAGNTDIAVSAIGRKDEIGEMAAAVQVFKERAVETLRLEAEASAARRASDVGLTRFGGRLLDLGGLRDQGSSLVMVVAPFVVSGGTIAKA